ncbi:MAG: YhfC family intramembrane metalloprotease [Paenibacillus sp.]|nr:YhfC family intramembrane metalloprotease [Paenibacillus sp.]
MTLTQENKHVEVQETTDPFAGVSQRALKFLPLYLLVPILYWIIFKTMGYELNWTGFALGALGWTVALFLRGPLSLLVQKWPVERAKNVIVSSSGVLEEGVRVILLVLTSVSFSWAQSVGQGWAAIEVLFVIINVIMITVLIKRTDEKAMQAKEMLQTQGHIQASPLWGILERIWASAFHIGATLVIAHNAWLVLLMIPLHSGLNLIAVRMAKGSILRTNMLVAAVGLITLAIGVLIF